MIDYLIRKSIDKTRMILALKGECASYIGKSGS